MDAIALRVAARFSKEAEEAPVWLPDLLGSKERVAKLLFQELRKLVQHGEGFSKKDPKAVAGGLCYFLVRNRAGEAVAQKLWRLLDQSAGLDASSEVSNLADSAARHLTVGREKGAVEAAAVGVSLLQRTRQPNKAQRANAILVDVLGERVKRYGPPETEPEVGPAGAFGALVTGQKLLATGVATQLGNDPALAATVVWDVLTDVNAHGESRLAEEILSPLVPAAGHGDSVKYRGFMSVYPTALDWFLNVYNELGENDDPVQSLGEMVGAGLAQHLWAEFQKLPSSAQVQFQRISLGDEFQRNLLDQWMGSFGEGGGGIPEGLVSDVSQALDYDILGAGAFGVALMQAVGQGTYANKLQKALGAAFKKYLVPQL